MAVERFPTRDAALAAERSAIAAERPLHNIAHNDGAAGLEPSGRELMPPWVQTTVGVLTTPRVAATESELVELLGVPISTYMAEKAKGRGPRTFKIGRRNFVLLKDWAAWLHARAEQGDGGNDGEPRAA